jgi:hypothetical protein
MQVPQLLLHLQDISLLSCNRLWQHTANNFLSVQATDVLHGLLSSSDEVLPAPGFQP